ncbi:MAG: redoxin domain-containing protein [Saprospiraceae bacterium]|uniref:Redoxin domain-containing protein n=1 Tax=Candidatus Opimibacter skivensis TaxID=2982028 RepID=A0A9D7XRL1_9BACT|nr:redoxin domain-containing protein [Candidatus Opimibacter skivensis]
MRLLFVLSIFLFSGLANVSASSLTTSGYRIEVTLQHYQGDSLFLGYYFGKAQYLKDTALLEKGKFVFQGEGKLEPGVYLLVIPPDNKFIHVIVSDDEQKFSASVDLDNIVSSAKFKGSDENEIYYSYLHELEKRRPIADSLKKQMKLDSLHSEDYHIKLNKIDADVMKVQDEVRAKHPASITSMLIWANREIEIPKYENLTEDDRKQKQYEYYKAHFFDHFDLTDPRAMRSGVIQQKVDYYLQKLTYQVPDSQIVEIDYLLKKMLTNKEAFQYYLVYFLNDVVKSKRMGMDAAYVHLVDTYYAKGLADWIDKEQLDKLLAQADVLRPILIGKIAPDLTLYKESGEAVNLHAIKANYTVLFFWDPECGHCKKAIPFIIDFYNEYKSKGVEVVAVCTKTGSDVSSCWSAIKERGMDIWVNTCDQYMQSHYKTIYDVKVTPQIYVLDKNKKILVKKIAGEDLKPVMDEIFKDEESKQKNQ